MAPGRGRRGGRGETRMDAALDALVPMGFPKQAIRKMVNELLKVYGKPDGWVFIEEASYKLLIEALLGGEEGSEPGPPLLMIEDANEDNMHGDAGSSSAAGPSNATETPALYMIPPLMDAEKTCADGGSHQDSGITDDVSFPQNASDNVSPPWIQRNHPPMIEYSPPPPPPPETEYVPPPPPPKTNNTPPAGPSIPRMTNISSRKRRPCYGWWEEETDLICLPLMPVPSKKACRGPA